MFLSEDEDEDECEDEDEDEVDVEEDGVVASDGAVGDPDDVLWWDEFL